MYSAESLTNIISLSIEKSKEPENLGVTLSGSSPNIQAIFILDRSANLAAMTKTVYSKEISIFGKAIRILYHLHQAHNVLNLLDLYEVKRVIVTNTKNPMSPTPLDTHLFYTADLQKVFKELDNIKRYSPALLEQTIQGTILENRK